MCLPHMIKGVNIRYKENFRFLNDFFFNFAKLGGKVLVFTFGRTKTGYTHILIDITGIHKCNRKHTVNCAKIENFLIQNTH